VTAGICEEILYRGYLFWYLGHRLEPIPTLVVASVIFGFGHTYQGLRGVLLTTAVGAFLGLAYGVTGSLFAPMLIHALMDLHSGHLGYVAFRRERELLAEATAEPAGPVGPLEGPTPEPAAPAPGSEGTTPEPARDPVV
jgi:membrane protease YdiL (CAAX protease family)